MQSLRKLSPLPQLSPLNTRPLAPLGVKIFFGMFLASILAQIEEISPKIPRMYILRKLSPLSPLCGPLRSQKNFWDVSGIYLSSSLKKYHQRYQECRF